MLITACSNPLYNPNKKETATFLVDASKYAEKQLHIKDAGYLYRDCMNGKKDAKTCESVYQKMVKYGKTHEYKNLSVSDLKDQKIWASLKDDYFDVNFNSLD